MFLSKIWFILVTIAGGVALTVALTAPRPMVQKLQDLEGQRLDRTQYAAEQMLKIESHRWIDRVATLGRDAVIADALDAATRGSGDLALQHRTVQARFNALLPDLAAAGIATLAAVDGNGRIIARIGQGEKEYGENIGGAEVIADALRGYLSDDVWGAGGRLLRVAGAPVLSKGRDRIVGALYIGAETGTAFVNLLKTNLMIDAAVLLRGKVVASTIDSSLLGQLPDLVAQRQGEIEDLKRSEAIPVEVGDETLLAVAAPFPGEAALQGAYYVVIGKKPAHADLRSLLAATSARDLKWSTFPWIGLVGAILAVVAVGLFLQMLEVERPIARLRAELRRLVRGDAPKVDDHLFGGKFGGIARDVNAAIEHHTMAPGPQGPMAGKDIAAILGGDAPAPDSPFASSPAFAAAPVPKSAPPGPPPPAPAPGLGPLAAPAFAPPPPPSFAPPPASPGIIPPTPPLPRAVPGLPPAALAGSSLPAPPAAAAAAAPSPPAAPSPMTRTMIGTGMAGAGIPGAGVPAPSQPPSPASGASGADDDEAHMRQVYEEFVATKQQCGESVAGLTIDKFRLRLQENKNSLMAKHHCRTVRFAVYVKDGKASLRATPVK
jgi:hypothetical protein